MKNKKAKKILSIFFAICIIMIFGIFVYSDLIKNNENDIAEVIEPEVIERDIELLSPEFYEINIEEKTISYDRNISLICLSKNPEEPSSEDRWIVTNGARKLDLSDYADEIEELNYVYYAADVVSNFQSSTYNSNATVFTISDKTEFAAFRDKVNAGTTFSGKTVYLMGNLSLTGLHTPIGTSSKPFSGIFDGNGYTISNLNITSSTTENVGLFGYVSGGTIKNVVISSGTITRR